MFLVCSEHHSLLTNKWQSNTQKQTPMLAETNTKCWLKIELYCSRCDEWWRWASASNSLAQTMGLDELMSWLTPTSAVKVENENDHATGTTELEIAMKAFKRKTACGQELPCTTSWGPSYGPHRRRWRDASWIQCCQDYFKDKKQAEMMVWQMFAFDCAVVWKKNILLFVTCQHSSNAHSYQFHLLRRNR